MAAIRLLILTLVLAASAEGTLLAQVRPSIPPARPPGPNRPAEVRPKPPESPPEGVMIVRPNPNAGRLILPENQGTASVSEEIYFHRSDQATWPGALEEFARDLEIHYLDWLSSTARGPLDEGAAMIYDALESGTDLAGRPAGGGEAGPGARAPHEEPAYGGSDGDDDYGHEEDYGYEEDSGGDSAYGGRPRTGGGAAAGGAQSGYGDSGGYYGSSSGGRSGGAGYGLPGGGRAGDGRAPDAYGYGRTPAALRALLAASLDALAVDRSGYWHVMAIGGEDEEWWPTGARRRGGGW